MGRYKLIAVGAAAALALPGCGPTPPQAPGPEAHRLNVALSILSSACGHAAEVQAFSRSPTQIRGLDRSAAAEIPVVARIYRRNPGWVFQGKTVARLVRISVGFLNDCGLHQAASRLQRAAP